MKFATTVCVAAAPLAMARRVADVSSPGAVPRNDVKTALEARTLAAVKGMQGAGLSAGALAEVIIIWANPGNGAAATTIHQAHAVAGGAWKTGPPAPGSGQAGATTTTKEGQTPTAPHGKGASHTVKVGGPGGGLTYQPEQLNNVPVGDTVVFEFLAQNHSVTQSAFDAPCVPLAGGMDSGFLANPNNSVSPPPQVAMQVMTTKPLWFYCRQKGHCGKGMVFSVNPTADKTHAMFKALAINKQTGNGAATPVTGWQQSVTPVAPVTSVAPVAPVATVAPVAEAPKQNPAAGQDKQAGQAGTGVTPGKGTIGADGSCSCVVSCSAGAFPAAQVQGVGAFGGMGGALPIMGSVP
ncbi:hypothetical protein E4U41_005624 [Claviceps citrina]|nr:hypothetical protein E4U41_005624 [Claviceps citrina]